MRVTSAYYVGGVAAFLVALLIIVNTNNVVLGVIVGIAAGVAGYKITSAIEKGAEKGINHLVYSGSRELVKDLLTSTLMFETSVDKEKIISSLQSKYPTETPVMALKPNWACSRENDALFFVVGLRSMKYVKGASTPYTVAKLSFQAAEGGAANATFAFVSRSDYNDGSVPFAKQMAELVGTVKDTFTSFDAQCKISESKGDSK